MVDARRVGYFYILMNKGNTVLYVGVTSDLVRRGHEHKHRLVPGFTSRYNVSKLVYYEKYPTVPEAIEREKQIKSWRRKKKIELIKTENPTFKDLYFDLTC